jgi:hypothetical protein
LPGMSINWGAWSEIGAAARHQVPDRLYRTGLSVIPTKFGLKALERSLGSSLTQVGITPINWPQFFHQFTSDRRETWLNTFLTSATLTGPDQSPHQLFAKGTLLSRLRETKKESRSELLRAYVIQQLREVLRIAPTETVAPNHPLNEMGMDSLIGTELKNRFTAELNIDISLKNLIGNATVSDVVQEIEERLALAELTRRDSSGEPANLEIKEFTI